MVQIVQNKDEEEEASKAKALYKRPSNKDPDRGQKHSLASTGVTVNDSKPQAVIKSSHVKSSSRRRKKDEKPDTEDAYESSSSYSLEAIQSKLKQGTALITSGFNKVRTWQQTSRFFQKDGAVTVGCNYAASKVSVCMAPLKKRFYGDLLTQSRLDNPLLALLRTSEYRQFNGDAIVAEAQFNERAEQPRKVQLGLAEDKLFVADYIQDEIDVDQKLTESLQMRHIYPLCVHHYHDEPVRLTLNNSFRQMILSPITNVTQQHKVYNMIDQRKDAWNRWVELLYRINRRYPGLVVLQESETNPTQSTQPSLDAADTHTEVYYECTDYDYLRKLSAYRSRLQVSGDAEEEVTQQQIAAKRVVSEDVFKDIIEELPKVRKVKVKADLSTTENVIKTKNARKTTDKQKPIKRVAELEDAVDDTRDLVTTTHFQGDSVVPPILRESSFMDDTPPSITSLESATSADLADWKSTFKSSVKPPGTTKKRRRRRNKDEQLQEAEGSENNKLKDNEEERSNAKPQLEFAVQESPSQKQETAKEDDTGRNYRKHVEKHSETLESTDTNGKKDGDRIQEDISRSRSSSISHSRSGSESTVSPSEFRTEDTSSNESTTSTSSSLSTRSSSSSQNSSIDRVMSSITKLPNDVDTKQKRRTNEKYKSKQQERQQVHERQPNGDGEARTRRAPCDRQYRNVPIRSVSGDEEIQKKREYGKADSTIRQPDEMKSVGGQKTGDTTESHKDRITSGHRDVDRHEGISSSKQVNRQHRQTTKDDYAMWIDKRSDDDERKTEEPAQRRPPAEQQIRDRHERFSGSSRKQEIHQLSAREEGRISNLVQANGADHAKPSNGRRSSTIQSGPPSRTLINERPARTRQHNGQRNLLHEQQIRESQYQSSSRKQEFRETGDGASRSGHSGKMPTGEHQAASPNLMDSTELYGEKSCPKELSKPGKKQRNDDRRQYAESRPHNDPK